MSFLEEPLNLVSQETKNNFKAEHGPLGQTFLELIGTPSFMQSADMGNTWETRGGQFVEFLRSDLMKQLLNQVAVRDDARSRFLTGLILSSLTAEEIEDETETRLGIQNIGADLKVILSNYKPNCMLSEEYMERALNQGRYISVNDVLVLKCYGHYTALCVQTASTNRGTFFEGSWYTPFDTTTQTLIRDCEEGVKRINFESGDWVYERDSSLWLKSDERLKLVDQVRRVI